MKKMYSSVKRLIKKSWIVLILVISFTSISFVDNYFDISKNLETFATLYRELNTYYVDEIDPATLMRTGIDAMLKSLDPYTKFISESEVEDYQFQTTGKYGGIGAIIQKHKEYVIIKEPYKGFPADKSGLIAGDIILEIDGQSAKDKNTEQVSKVLKGTPGTEVNILVKRPHSEKEITVKIIREEIKINSVSYFGMLTDEIGYIQLSSFTHKAGKEVKDALITLKENPDMKALVFDLRGNPGGLLNEAINIANTFIPKGEEIVKTKGKIKEWQKVYRAINIPVDTEMPLVILANGGSASASEIVSGAVQDLDRGVVVGRQTFGKGLVQTTRLLPPYKNQLKVTTAKYYIPSGRCIQAIDYAHKNEDGSAGKIPDSLKTEYKTKNGRSVFDGAGIAPDIEVESPQLSQIIVSLITKNLFFDYVTIYRSKHDSIATPKEFEVTEEDYEDFVAFLSDKEYDYTTKSEELLTELKEKTQKEKYYDAIKEDLEVIQSKMLHDKKKDLQKYKKEIKEFLKSEIAIRYYYRKGQIETTFADDEVIQEAIELLKDKKHYYSILGNKNKN